MTQEEKTSAASYILQFYSDVGQLTHYFSQYINIIIELERMTGSSPEETNVQEAHKQTLIQTVQNLRYYAHNVYIRYSSIFKALEEAKKEGKNKKNKTTNPLKQPYENLEKQFIIQRKEAEKFVLAANEVLIDAVMKDLLKTSQDLIDSIYE